MPRNRASAGSTGWVNRAAFSSVGLTGGNFDEDLYDHAVLRAVARVTPFDADGPQRSELRKAAEEVGVDIDER